MLRGSGVWGCWLVQAVRLRVRAFCGAWMGRWRSLLVVWLPMVAVIMCPFVYTSRLEVSSSSDYHRAAFLGSVTPPPLNFFVFFLIVPSSPFQPVVYNFEHKETEGERLHGSSLYALGPTNPPCCSAGRPYR